MITISRKSKDRTAMAVVCQFGFHFKMAAAALIFWAMASGALVYADEAKPLYENNFEKAEVGKVPEEFLVLDGEFAVKEEGGNKFLELPGAPLDSFGLLFGPTEKSDVAVSARINGTKKGRRFPTFGVGLNGQSGYRLQVSPAKGALELYHGETDIVATAPYEWKSGEWTLLRLQLVKSGDVWKLEGKAWTQGAPEPAQAMISFEEKNEPSAGRASIWGSPISTTPIQFDDLVLKSVTVAK
jgi:hypothetical protein